MIDDQDLYLDRVQLAARGWTRTLRERFLPTPDRWATVDHWKNYTGKATYFVEKVMAREQLVAFRQAFAASVARRGLTPQQVEAAMQERARVDALYRAWLRTVTPEDVKLMIAINAAAAEFEKLRAMGYRTPHK
jgi:hypothetical protein